MQDYKFTCPSCGRDARIHEICHCDGVQSEISGFEKSHLPVGKSDPVYGCEYIDAVGVGNVVDVTFQCSECGEEIAPDTGITREDLVELGYVQLSDDLRFPLVVDSGGTIRVAGGEVLAQVNGNGADGRGLSSDTRNAIAQRFVECWNQNLK